MGYKLEPWKLYDLPDNGAYGPIGSKPTFHTEHTLMRRSVNPIHPHVIGYIMHDEMAGNEIPPVRRILASVIVNPDKEYEP